MYPVSVKGVLLAPGGEVGLPLNEREEWELPGGRIDLGESSVECLAIVHQSRPRLACLDPSPDQTSIAECGR
jgi:hypothetical protein